MCNKKACVWCGIEFKTSYEGVIAPFGHEWFCCQYHYQEWFTSKEQQKI